MTREQYYEMAENFCKYGNNEVEYKTLNLHPTKSNPKKYNTKTAILVGVGILGNAEHLILQDLNGGGRKAIHYSRISYPTTFKFERATVKVYASEFATFADVLVDGKKVHEIRTSAKGAYAAELAYHDAIHCRII